MQVIEHVYFLGKAEELEEMAGAYAQSGDLKRVREEDGCIAFDFYQAAECPGKMLLLERWQSDAHLKAHHETEMMAHLLALIERYGFELKGEKFLTEGEA